MNFRTGIVLSFVLLPRLQTSHVASHEWFSPCVDKMAGVLSHTTLYPEVLEAIDAFVNSQPKGKFSDFKLPSAFVERCRLYLKCSPAPCGNTASRFELPFECFVQYNYYKEPRGEEFNEKVINVYADPEEIGGWQNAIRCLQRYCFNLLLAPKRKDFHYIKVSILNYLLPSNV